MGLLAYVVQPSESVIPDDFAVILDTCHLQRLTSLSYIMETVIDRVVSKDFALERAGGRSSVWFPGASPHPYVMTPFSGRMTHHIIMLLHGVHELSVQLHLVGPY